MRQLFSKMAKTGVLRGAFVYPFSAAQNSFTRDVQENTACIDH